MTTYTIYGDTADGYISSSGGTYTQNRAGTGGDLVVYDTSTTDSGIGQTEANDKVFESFISFNTTSVAGTITSASLSLYGSFDESTTDFTVTAAVRDWGASLTTGDFVAGASLGALTTVATFNTASSWSESGYNTFTDVALPANVNKGGTTRLILYSSRTSAGTAPPADEAVWFIPADASGTTNDPNLVVVTSGSRPQRHRRYHIWRR